MFLKEGSLPDLRSEVVSKGASEPQAGPAREPPLGAAGGRWVETKAGGVWEDGC